MSLFKMAEKLKPIHKDFVIMYKVGSFYQVFGKDAYIIAGMYGYIIKPVGNTVNCGFGLNAINKVKNGLENSKINYLLLDPRNNYDVDEKSDNRNLNTYNEQLKKYYLKIKQQNEIKHICERLNMFVGTNEFKNIVRKVEDLLDENGEI